jgi:hypothetical protein
VADQRAPAGDLGPVQQLLDEAGLADSGLTLDDDDRQRRDRGDDQ